MIIWLYQIHTKYVMPTRCCTSYHGMNQSMNSTRGAQHRRSTTDDMSFEVNIMLNILWYVPCIPTNTVLYIYRYVFDVRYIYTYIYITYIDIYIYMYLMLYIYISHEVSVSFCIYLPKRAMKIPRPWTKPRRLIGHDLPTAGPSFFSCFWNEENNDPKQM